MVSISFTGPPGKCAVYKCITVFDLMQPAEV